MEQEFSKSTSIDQRTCYQYRAWVSCGIVHGFLGQDWDFSNTGASQHTEAFCRAFDVEQLIVLNQVHGNKIMKIESGNVPSTGRLAIAGEADSFVVRPNENARRRVAFGVRTADCLPILMRCADTFALVHAGWRGLAEGIVQAATCELTESDDAAALEVIIGPAAGAEKYEVGPEVIEALRPFAQYKNSAKSGHYLLSLAETAVAIVRSCRENAVIHNLPFCTISSHLFHSHRRDGEHAGRNLSFISVPL